MSDSTNDPVVRGATPADADDEELKSRNLGLLIEKLKRHEHIKPWLDENYPRILRQWGPAEAKKWRDRYAARLFRHDPKAWPGIDRIALLCDQLDNDNGFTAANIVKLRAKVCRAKPCTLAEADLVSLDDAADLLDGEHRAKTKAKGKSKSSRGAKVQYDAGADKRLCEHWKAAKGQGMTRDAFAREKGISVNDIIAALNREKYRRLRDAE